MESTGLLVLIFGIWAAVVIPVWLRERRSGSVQNVAQFRSVMALLRDGRGSKSTPATVEGKRSPKAGYMAMLRERGLRRRRIAFLLAMASVPFALALQAAGLVSATIWVLPPLAITTFVAYARYSLAQLRKLQQGGAGREALSETQETVRRPSRALTSGLSALRKIAMRRLVETEPKLKTEQTPAWQSAGDLGSPWSAPEPILPSYVKQPTSQADSAAVAEAPASGLPGVDGKALVEAARAQRDLAAIAEQVAAAQSTASSSNARPDDDTSEIVRIIGA